MKALHLLLAGAVSLLAIISCKEDNVEPESEPEPEQGTEYDEAWYADNATISSSDAHFADTEEGWEISFKAEGGSVVVYVDCGAEWTADDSEAGVFGCEVQETFITVTADQNLVEEELHGTITLMTAESQIHFATISITQNAYGAPEIKVETYEWNIPAVAADPEEFTTEIGVEATGEWEIESEAEWLTAEKGENSVILTAAENETTEERVAEVVLTCTDGYNSDSEIITVTQDARAYITLSEEVFEVAAKGGTDTLTVESNYEWSYAYESDWFTVAENGDGSLTVTVNANTVEEAREGVVTFTAGDGAANVAEATFAITQNAYGAPEIKVETYEWNIPAVAADPEEFTTEIGVEATDDWEVESDAEWLTAEKGENSVILTAAENGTTEERVAEVVLTCTDGYNSDSETITVTQDARAYITISEEELEFDKKGGEATVTVESNYEWSYAYESDWFTVAENTDGSLTVTVNMNTVEEAREGVVTFTAGDGAANVAEATLTITQNAYSVPEITLGETEWHAPATGGTMTINITVEATDEWEATTEIGWLTVTKTETGISLTAAQNIEPAERTGEVEVSCSDGVTSVSETITVTQDARAHITLSAEEFAFDRTGGETEVTVESNYEWGYVSEGDWFTVAENGDGSLTITAGANATGNDREGTVTFTAGDGAANTATATLTITQETFDPASLVLEYTITSDGTTIRLLMYASTMYTIDCTVDWGDGETETTSSSRPSHTYSDAGTYYVSISGTVDWLDSDSDSGRECLTAVIQWGDIGLTRMTDAFAYCSNLASIPDGPGPFENVADFSAAFLSCESLTTVPVDIFSNCTSVAIDFTNVFSGCTNLIVAPSFEGLSNVTYFDYIFWGCTSLTSLPENMFSGCTASLIFFNGAFRDCTSLTTVPVNIFTGCPSIGLCGYTFSGCSSVSGESPYDEITVDGETVKVHLYERENYPEYYYEPVETYGCFYNSSFSDIDDIPDDWKY